MKRNRNNNFDSNVKDRESSAAKRIWVLLVALILGTIAIFLEGMLVFDIIINQQTGNDKVLNLILLGAFIAAEIMIIKAVGECILRK